MVWEPGNGAAKGVQFTFSRPRIHFEAQHVAFQSDISIALRVFVPRGSPCYARDSQRQELVSKTGVAHPAQSTVRLSVARVCWKYWN